MRKIQLILSSDYAFIFGIIILIAIEISVAGFCLIGTGQYLYQIKPDALPLIILFLIFIAPAIFEVIHTFCVAISTVLMELIGKS